VGLLKRWTLERERTVPPPEPDPRRQPPSRQQRVARPSPAIGRPIQRVRHSGQALGRRAGTAPREPRGRHRRWSRSPRRADTQKGRASSVAPL